MFFAKSRARWWINLNNVSNTQPRTHTRAHQYIKRGVFKEIVRSVSGYIRVARSRAKFVLAFASFSRGADVADVEGHQHVEDRSRFRADTMAKASTLGSIVAVRRTTCWILKRYSLPPSLSPSARATGGATGGEQRLY